MGYSKVYHNGTALDALYRGSVKLYPLGYTIKQLIDANKLSASVSGNTLFLTPADGFPPISQITDFVDVMLNGATVEGYTHSKVNFAASGSIGNEYRDVLASNNYTISFPNLMLRNLTVNGDILLNWTSGGNWTYNDGKPFQNTSCDQLLINYPGNFSSLHNVFQSFKGYAIAGVKANMNSGDLSGCFEFCNNLSDLSGVNINWDNVTNIGYAFEWCESLHMIPGNGYTTKPITWAAQAFNYAVNLAEIEPILDVSRLTPGSDNTYKMFNACSSLRTVKLKGINNADWDFTTDLTGLDDESIHYICVNATDLDGGSHMVKFNKTKAELHTILTNDEIMTLKSKGWTLYATDGEVNVEYPTGSGNYTLTKVTSLDDINEDDPYIVMTGGYISQGYDYEYAMIDYNSNMHQYFARPSGDTWNLQDNISWVFCRVIRNGDGFSLHNYSDGRKIGTDDTTLSTITRLKYSESDLVYNLGDGGRITTNASDGTIRYAIQTGGFWISSNSGYNIAYLYKAVKNE